MSVNVILSGHGMNSEPYLANLAATEEGIAYIYNAKRDLDEAEGEFYLTSELMDQPLDMTSLDENGELSDFITALRVWDRVAKENVAKKIDFQSLGNFPKGSINQILAYSEVDEEGNPTGFKAMAALGGVNANLLHNWYFANPVNQRGQTEYTGAGYGIDRWRATAQSGKVLLLENAVRVSTSNDSTPGWFCQILENPTAFSGKTVTFSMLVTAQDTSSWRIAFKDAATAGGSGNYAIEDFEFAAGETALISVTKKIDVGVAVSLLQNRNTTEKFIDILAAKLELGEGQTLAHQDADGNWVLNEIPNYGEELIRCQSAPVDIDGAGGVLPLTGGTVTGTLVLSKTTDLSETENKSPALIVGGQPTGSHIEIDNNEIWAKSNATNWTTLYTGPLAVKNGEGAVSEKLARNIYGGTSGMTAGTTSMYTGNIYLQYE